MTDETSTEGTSTDTSVDTSANPPSGEGSTPPEGTTFLEGDSQPSGEKPAAPTETPTEPPAAPTTEKTETPGSSSDASGEAPPERVVPAADEYVLPEGVDKKFGAIANKLGYTQDQLDNTLKAFGDVVSNSRDIERRSILKEGSELVNSWGEQKKTNLTTIKTGLEAIDPEGSLKTVLQASGYDNHPAVLSALLRVGKSLEEGGFINSNLNVPRGKTIAEKMYPSMVKNKT
jgi:hypothetical protein